MQCPANAPVWLKAAWKEIGAREQPGNRGPAVQRFIDLAHCGEQGDPWCAIFANAMLESAGFAGTRSASSQSFRSDAHFVALPGPVLGAIAVFWRASKQSGLGHVGFYCGERGGYVNTLGGNESDMVQVEFLAKAAGTFGLVGYYWPKAAPLPRVKGVAAPIPAPEIPAAPLPTSAAPAPAEVPLPPERPPTAAPGGVTWLQMDNSVMGDINVVKSLFKSKIAWLAGGLGGTSAGSIADANPDLVELLKRIALTPAFWLAVAALGCAGLLIYFRWCDHGRGANHV